MLLKQQALSGVKWTSVSSIVVLVIQLMQLVILAHFLNPSDFGLMAIVTVIIGFSALFMDMGISASIIHRQDITHVQLSSLYWLNIASGIVLFFMVYSLVPILASFYNETKLIPIIRILSFTFIISGIGNQYGILFQKSFQFNLIAKISIISSVTSFIVSVSLAIYGFGIYSLVYAALASSLIVMFMNVFIGIKDYKPSFVYQHREVIPMISFGIFQMSEKAINYFNAQFDVILIGKLLGAEVLGIYSIGKNLAMRPVQIINPIITKVTFPIMAKVQNDTVQLRNIYLKTINYLSSINFPIYVLLVISAEPIILILFGEKWQDSIIILQILSIYAAFQSIGNPIGSVLLSKGRADLGFYWNLGLFFIITLAIYIGSFGGIIGVAYSLFLSTVFLYIPSWYFLVNPLCEAGFKEYSWQILKPLILSIISGLFSNYFISYFCIENIWLNIVFISINMGLIMLILNILFNYEFIDTFLQLFKKGERR